MLSCQIFTDLLIELIALLLFDSLMAHFDGSVKNLGGEVQLHQVLEDAKHNDLASRETTDKGLSKHV